MAGGVICWPMLYTSFHPIGVGIYLGLVIAAVIGLGGIDRGARAGTRARRSERPIGWLLRVPGAPVMFAGCLGLAGDSFLHVLFGFNFWKLERSLHLKMAMACFVVAAMVAVAARGRPLDRLLVATRGGRGRVRRRLGVLRAGLLHELLRGSGSARISASRCADRRHRRPERAARRRQRSRARGARLIRSATG